MKSETKIAPSPRCAASTTEQIWRIAAIDLARPPSARRELEDDMAALKSKVARQQRPGAGGIGPGAGLFGEPLGEPCGSAGDQSNGR